ncbi:MAG: Zn-ribbon domain-containing OB-fold protein [Gammaproteobacteria bacterium]
MDSFKEKDYFESLISLDYTYTAGAATSRFLEAIAEGKLIGQQCPKCGAVYVPPRGSCPRDGVPTSEEVLLRDKGCIESFTVVHIPIPGNPIEPPFVSAMIRLDGSHISFLHLIQEVPLENIRIGMRVQAVWKPEDEWTTSLENIKWFKPSGEPDVNPESLRFNPK